MPEALQVDLVRNRAESAERCWRHGSDQVGICEHRDRFIYWYEPWLRGEQKSLIVELSISIPIRCKGEFGFKLLQIITVELQGYPCGRYCLQRGKSLRLILPARTEEMWSV